VQPPPFPVLAVGRGGQEPADDVVVPVEVRVHRDGHSVVHAQQRANLWTISAQAATSVTSQVGLQGVSTHSSLVGATRTAFRIASKKVGGEALLVPGLALYGGGFALVAFLAQPGSCFWVLLAGFAQHER